MSRKYTKPPIREAICQFNFANDSKWDWTIPGLLYQEINNDYPIKREIRKIGTEFQVKPDDTTTDIEYIPLIRKIEGMRFLNKEENRMIQIQEKMLAIYVLKPYSTWTEFKDRIIKSLKIYNKLTNPKGILRIGLRYINQFDFISDGSRIEKYFNYYPNFPDDNQVTIGELIVKSTIPMPNFENQRGFMHVILYLNKPNIGKEKGASNILDLDMVFRRDEENMIGIKKVEKYIDEAYVYTKEIFESYITDELRKEIQ